MNCDKCGLPVEPTNDAVRVDAIVSGQAFTLMLFSARHFLPTETCAGSPSRAQYIEGQPRDQRGYGYFPEYESKYRTAYAELQRQGF